MKLRLNGTFYLYFNYLIYSQILNFEENIENIFLKYICDLNNFIK